MVITGLKPFVHRVRDRVQVMQGEMAFAELSILEGFSNVLIHNAAEVLD